MPLDVRPTPATPASPVVAPLPPGAPPVLDSDRLLQGQRQVWIRHAGQTYRLCHTRNGKLILTK